MPTNGGLFQCVDRPERLAASNTFMLPPGSPSSVPVRKCKRRHYGRHQTIRSWHGCRPISRLSSASTCAGSCSVWEATWTKVGFAAALAPSRAITIINPFPPGGTSEIVTRPLAAAWRGTCFTRETEDDKERRFSSQGARHGSRREGLMTKKAPLQRAVDHSGRT